MMTKDEFAEEMGKMMQEALGERYEVSVQHVTRNNGVERTGLMVKDQSNNIAPTIYVDSLYEDYEDGSKTMNEAAALATANVMRGMPRNKIDMRFFNDWEQVKDKICFRLVNAQRNEKMLADVPHEACGDLALTFFYPFENEEIGKGSILIRNEHFERWGISKDELIEAAVENTPRIYPPECMPMESVLMERMTGFGAEHYPELPEEPLEEGSPAGMMILTNGDRTYGASVIMYKDYMQRVAEAAQCDLYVIPCSVHECLILPKVGEEDAARLAEIIRDVNASQVDPQDVLSGNLYAYDRQSQTLSIAVAEGQAYGQGQEGGMGQTGAESQGNMPGQVGSQGQTGAQGQTSGQGMILSM